MKEWTLIKENNFYVIIIWFFFCNFWGKNWRIFFLWIFLVESFIKFGKNELFFRNFVLFFQSVANINFNYNPISIASIINSCFDSRVSLFLRCFTDGNILGNRTHTFTGDRIISGGFITSFRFSIDWKCLCSIFKRYLFLIQI